MALINRTPSSWYKPSYPYPLAISPEVISNKTTSPRVVFRKGQPAEYYTYYWLLRNPAALIAQHSTDNYRIPNVLDFNVNAANVNGALYDLWVTRDSDRANTPIAFRPKWGYGNSRRETAIPIARNIGTVNFNGEFDVQAEAGDYRLWLRLARLAARESIWRLTYYDGPQFTATVGLVLP